MSVVLIFFVAVLSFYYLQKKYELYLVGRKLPGPWALPLLGNVQMITRLKPEYIFLTINECRKRYRSSFRLWLGSQLWVFLHSPKETRDALNDPTLIKADTFQQLSVLIGNGLLISNGRIWEIHRRALGPAFHPNIINSFVPTIEHHVDRLLMKLLALNGNALEVNEYLFSCLLDAIVDTSMGRNLNTQLEPDSPYPEAFHNLSRLLFKRMVNPLLSMDIIFRHTNMYKSFNASLNIIHELIEEIILSRMEYLSRSKSFVTNRKTECNTLLDIMLTTEVNGKPFSFEEIHSEVNTFIFAGVDTTTAAMSFVLYALAKYPEEQNEVFREIQNAEFGEELCVGDVNKLDYLDMFIKETLRLFTIVPMTGRQTTKSTKIGNTKYCPGVTIWIDMYGLAHDEEIFEHPYEFHPKRFNKGIQQLPFSYLPFSGGPHVCIGRKYALLLIKILTIKILQKFIITLAKPNEEFKLMAQMVLKSVNGINLVFNER